MILWVTVCVNIICWFSFLEAKEERGLVAHVTVTFLFAGTGVLCHVTVRLLYFFLFLVFFFFKHR